ncbi:MAG: RIP metalloprotease RseP [Saprospiraceae bacterium]|nr:RIP metalloprotease RseP [Saprospiraceae bacterium]
MEYVVLIAQLILSLSILVVLHECGHFFPAKWFKTRVEKFYLFFDPYFSLFKKKIGETEYGIGWLPLGGYVKIAGMVDESFDTAQLQQEPQPWEFRSKPAWQRLIIMLGGVIVNFLLGIFIFAMLYWHWGEEYLPASQVSYGIYADSLGQQLGLQNGDKVLKVGNKPFVKFNDRVLVKEIVINGANTIEVERNGQHVVLPVNEKFVGILSQYDSKDKQLFTARVPFVAGKVVADMPAGKAGIKDKDKIIAINNMPTAYFDEFYTEIKKHKSDSVQVSVLRDDKDTISFALQTTPEGTIGIAPLPATFFYKTEKQKYSIVEAFPAGAKKGFGFLNDQIKAFGQMFKGKIKASESLGGFASITNLFPRQWDWEQFWNVTGVLSMILGFMNLLPIPGLDGGHVMFLLWEVFTGRKVSDKVMEYATMIGFALILGLMIYANGLDIFRFLKK